MKWVVARAWCSTLRVFPADFYCIHASRRSITHHAHTTPHTSAAAQPTTPTSCDTRTEAADSELHAGFADAGHERH